MLNTPLLNKFIFYFLILIHKLLNYVYFKFIIIFQLQVNFLKKFLYKLDISTPVTSNGYLKPLLITHVPGWGGPANGQGMNSYPNTPQNHMFHVNSPGNCSIRETSSVHSEPVNK